MCRTSSTSWTSILVHALHAGCVHDADRNMLLLRQPSQPQVWIKIHCEFASFYVQQLIV